jgi:hypothetical protein
VTALRSHRQAELLRQTATEGDGARV